MRCPLRMPSAGRDAPSPSQGGNGHYGDVVLHETVSDLSDLSEMLEGLQARTPQMRWSICIERDGERVAALRPDSVLATASLGKVFLLGEVSRGLREGTLDSGLLLKPVHEDQVFDSGLWQFFDSVDLSVEALAILVAAVSDNLATNVLLRHVGLASVQRLSESLAMPHTRMLDRIRDARGPQDPAAPSAGSASDYARFMRLVSSGQVVDEEVSSILRAWLATGVDLSMFAEAWCLDPLAHRVNPWNFFNKTGFDQGVRADAGAFSHGGREWSYAVICNWEASGTELDLRAMREIRGIGAATRAVACA